MKIPVHIKNNRAGEEVFRITPEAYAAAAARHPDIARHLDVTIDWDLDNFDASMARAQALVTWDLPTADLARRAPHLAWIHVIGAGVEHLAPFDWLPPGVALVNNRGVHAPKAREYAAMALAMLNAHMPALFTAQRARRFEALYATPIAGKTVTIVGVGAMGGAVAAAAKALGLRVIGVRRRPRPARHVDEMVGLDGLDRALAAADFVVVTTPLTPATRGLIDDRRLGLMKAGAGLVNLGRAAVVDYEAVVRHLREGHLGGAILDVFEPEPLPARSPLWDTPNLIITPHVAADDAADYVPRTLDLFFDNMGRHLAGRPLRNRVRPRLGY